MGKKRQIEVATEEEEVEVAASTSEVLAEESSLAAKVQQDKKEKPLPPGYVCNACGGSDHAIYNCPIKISKKKPKKSGASSESLIPELVEVCQEVAVSPASKGAAEAPEASAAEEEGGVEEHNKNKVYLSGLPFDMTNEKLTAFLASHDVVALHVRTMPFPDNDSKCIGVAFVTLNDEASTARCFELTGISMGRKTLKVEQITDKKKKGKATGERMAGGGRGGAAGGGRGGAGGRSGPGAPKAKKIPRCYRCGEMHNPDTCINPRICYRCKSFDHISSQCPKKKPKASE